MEFQQQDTMLFFARHEAAYPLYEALAWRLLARFPATTIQVRKTQISFSCRHLFACVSFARVRRELPPGYLVLTLGLPYPLESDRVAAKTEPYPGRWTTHFVLTAESDLDAALLRWIGEAYEFAQRK